MPFPLFLVSLFLTLPYLPFIHFLDIIRFLVTPGPPVSGGLLPFLSFMTLILISQTLGSVFILVPG
ncbi:hypothetical protein BDV24DRAFT_121939 [Aspergillus arachidicola]|uniref:Uncharacterized protein n=1 Tax=Aspergillus arachidicola TaxID=656916 RepID=A0A5N6YUQ6_9EURO|nr:hypothetical protein BDV24DRAFT_121939 [Aspergillus arachidicola]